MPAPLGHIPLGTPRYPMGTVPVPGVTLHRDTWVTQGTPGYSMGTVPAPGVTAPLGKMAALGVRPHRDAPGHVLWGDPWGWVTAPGVTLCRDTQVPHGDKGSPLITPHAS